jgi:hypothetical protein
VKLLNRAASTNHHIRNWMTFPESLDNKLQDFIENIRPPAPSDLLAENLNAIKNEFAEKIRTTVQTHMETVLKETNYELSKMERLDIEKARETAKKQIMNHLQNKIKHDELDRWINKAADLVGTDPSLMEEEEEIEETIKKKLKLDDQTAVKKPVKTTKGVKKAVLPQKIKPKKKTPPTTKKTKKIKINRKPQQVSDESRVIVVPNTPPHNSDEDWKSDDDMMVDNEIPCGQPQKNITEQDLN